jgi:hypothetical protein
MEHSFASATILLLLITDPLGNIPLFANALKAVPPARRARVIVREVSIAFAVLLGFMFAGEGFLAALGLSEVSLLIGGALVLFLIALRMIFPPPETTAVEPPGEPLGRKARDAVGAAAGGERHHDADRLVGPAGMRGGCPADRDEDRGEDANRRGRRGSASRCAHRPSPAALTASA